MKFSEKMEIAPLPDQIMRANQRFRIASSEGRDVINTGIGVLIEDNGQIFMPSDLRAHLPEVVEDTILQVYGYQTPRGHEGYLSATIIQNSLGGGSGAESGIASVQTAGGTGALATIARVLPEMFELKSKRLYIDGGWSNYQAIFKDYEVHTIRRLDKNGRYDHEHYIENLDSLPIGSPILLQAGGFNDDGQDRTDGQWDDVGTLIIKNELVPIIDSAYSRIFDPAKIDSVDPLLDFVGNDYPHFLAYSNSKNLGTYHNRLGALLVFGAAHNQRAAIQATLESAIRGTVSSLQFSVAEAVSRAYADKQNCISLEQLVMSKTLARRRAKLAAALGNGFEHVLSGKGLFTKLLSKGFDDKQHEELEKQGVIILESSRLNIGGIPTDKIERVAASLKSVL